MAVSGKIPKHKKSQEKRVNDTSYSFNMQFSKSKLHVKNIPPKIASFKGLSHQFNWSWNKGEGGMDSPSSGAAGCCYFLRRSIKVSYKFKFSRRKCKKLAAFHITQAETACTVAFSW